MTESYHAMLQITIWIRVWEIQVLQGHTICVVYAIMIMDMKIFIVFGSRVDAFYTLELIGLGFV